MCMKLLDFFTEVTDPRVERTKLHKLEDILAIAICATICGAEGWTEMAFSVSANSPGSKRFWNCPMAYPLTKRSDE